MSLVVLTHWDSCGNYVDGEYGGKDLRFPYPGLPVRLLPAKAFSLPLRLITQIAKLDKIDLNTFEADENGVEVGSGPFAVVSQVNG